MPSLAQPRGLRFLCHTVDHSYVTCSTQWTASLRSARLGAVRCPSEALSRASPRGVAEALQQVTRQLQQIPLRSSVCFLSLRQPRRALRVRLMGCEVKHHLLSFLHHVEVSEGSSATVGAGFSVCVAVRFQSRRKELGDEQREDGGPFRRYHVERSGAHRAKDGSVRSKDSRRGRAQHATPGDDRCLRSMKIGSDRQKWLEAKATVGHTLRSSVETSACAATSGLQLKNRVRLAASRPSPSSSVTDSVFERAHLARETVPNVETDHLVSESSRHPSYVASSCDVTCAGASGSGDRGVVPVQPGVCGRMWLSGPHVLGARLIRCFHGCFEDTGVIGSHPVFAMQLKCSPFLVTTLAPQIARTAPGTRSMSTLTE